MDEIIKRQDGSLRTWDGKPIRLTKDELYQALSPIFIAFPAAQMGDEQFNAYYMMLADLEPNQLARAVVKACQAHEYPTQMITVAAIRKAVGSDERPPGPRSDVDPHDLKPVPTKFFRLDPEEDRRQRMDRLRFTNDWDRYYE
jgi:hypothetical protein